MDLTILVVGLILGVGIPLRNKAIKKRRENMKEKGNEEKWKNMNKCRKCNYTFKKYEYLEIDYTAKGVVFLCTDKHKKVINSYAENGYRYVGFIPTEIDAKGCMRKIDLIFEKED